MIDHPSGFPPCEKTRLKTEEEAVSKLASARAAFMAGRAHRLERSYYFHTECEAWHLSSRPFSLSHRPFAAL